MAELIEITDVNDFYKELERENLPNEIEMLKRSGLENGDSLMFTEDEVVLIKKDSDDRTINN